MALFGQFVKKHRDLFSYIRADHAHPHDHFLNWLVLWMIPKYVTPNQVTLLRIVLTPIVFFLILSGVYTAGIVLFLFTAFTDAVDGSLARIRHQITRFGMLVDPLADKLLIGSMILLIVFQNYNIWLGIVILGLEILFIVSAAVAKVRFNSVRMANLWGKMKMVAQVCAVFLTLLGLLLSAPQFFAVGEWVFGLAIGLAIMSLFSQGI